ncbi:putative cold and drought-regulated protein CORA-like [Capsicum annuum]|nr:putative cold and drought-regulated protein CORA-like [Capsicum annuum]KAF3618748.1 putative cold and drought-regulated protein CORA-like [Capsicum annuum]
MEKSTLEGYEIPPTTIIYINSWSIARDPEIWKNPKEFIPERFLNNDIDFKREDYELIPFGTGRRGCPGITLGIAAIELALSNLLYAFDWELHCGLKKRTLMQILCGLFFLRLSLIQRDLIQVIFQMREHVDQPISYSVSSLRFASPKGIRLNSGLRFAPPYWDLPILSLESVLHRQGRYRSGSDTILSRPELRSWL